jgi:restriction system protein
VVYQITDRDLALLKEKPTEINARTLRQFPEFFEFHEKGTASDAAAVVTALSPEIKETPEESLEHSYQALREALATESLESVENGTPAAFEKIVVDLLVAMGYGGSVEDARKVVGKSGDGGIDGIINQDKLEWNIR